MSEKNKEKALEIVKDGITDLNDAVEALQIPGVSTAYSFVAFMTHKWEVRQFEQFLDGIRKRLDLDREQLLRELRENKGKKWMAEGLARGWRISLEAMDETARECANFMVADYIARKKAPDRFHRQFGNLFMESDFSILKVILEVADHLSEARSHYAEILSCLDRKSSAPSQVIYQLIINDEITPLVAEAQEAAETLVRNLFGGRAVVGTMSDHPCSDKFQMMDVLCHITPARSELWTQLRKYLEPVRTAKPAT